MVSEEVKTDSRDDLEKAIDRYSISGFDMGLNDDEDYIPVTILKNILDHFIPKWRRHEDRYFKLKKFATEQQLDTNISKLRNYVDEKTETVMREALVGGPVNPLRAQGAAFCSRGSPSEDLQFPGKALYLA